VYLLVAAVQTDRAVVSELHVDVKQLQKWMEAPEEWATRWRDESHEDEHH